MNNREIKELQDNNYEDWLQEVEESMPLAGDFRTRAQREFLEAQKDRDGAVLIYENIDRTPEGVASEILIEDALGRRKVQLLDDGSIVEGEFRVSYTKRQGWLIEANELVLAGEFDSRQAAYSYLVGNRDALYDKLCGELPPIAPLEDEGDQAEREMVEAEMAQTKEKCGLCGSVGPCGCDEPERGNAYLDLMDLFESKGVDVDQIPDDAVPVTDEFWMGLGGIYFQEGEKNKVLRIAPVAEHSKALRKLVMGN